MNRGGHGEGRAENRGEGRRGDTDTKHGTEAALSRVAGSRIEDTDVGQWTRSSGDGVNGTMNTSRLGQEVHQLGWTELVIPYPSFHFERKETFGVRDPSQW